MVGTITGAKSSVTRGTLIESNAAGRKIYSLSIVCALVKRGYGDLSFQMSEIIKSLTFFQSHIYVRTEKTFIRRKMYQKIILGPSGKNSLFLALLLYKNLLYSPCETGGALSSLLLHKSQKPVEPFLRHILRYLIFHLRGRRPCSPGI